MSGAPTMRTRGVRLYSLTTTAPSWLSRVMVPLARTVRADHGASVAYLGRGWKHGSHVDLVAYGDAELPWTELLDRTDLRLQELGPPATEQEYLAKAHELGRLERIDPPYLPLHPRGTVEWLRGPSHAYLSPELSGLADTVLTRLFEPLALTLDQAGTSDVVPFAALAEAFIALIAAHPWGPAYGVFSLRSHSEAFLNWMRSQQDRRPEFEARLEADAPVLRTLVQRTRDGGESAAAAAWRSGFAYGMGHFDAAVATGLLTPELLDEISARNERPDSGPPGSPDATPSRSEFHETVTASKVTERPPGWFASYRLLINLFYGRLPLLGVSPVDRFYLCFAVAETVDEVYGSTWRERLQAVARRRGR